MTQQSEELMGPFRDYARYYYILYAEKDYEGEVDIALFVRP